MNGEPEINSNRGKIGALPPAIREEVCRRMFDGQTAPKILPWLNGLPEVLKILREDFEGLRVSDQNLSTWRKTGYRDWLKRRERLDRTRELAGYATKLAQANGATIAEGAQAIAGGKLLELLEVLDETLEDEEGKPIGAESLVAIAGALTALRSSEQVDVKLALEKIKVAQKGEQLELDKQKFMRDSAGIALKVLKDKRAQQIESGDGSYEEKIEAMGQHLFPGLWKARHKGK